MPKRKFWEDPKLYFFKVRFSIHGNMSKNKSFWENPKLRWIWNWKCHNQHCCSCHWVHFLLTNKIAFFCNSVSSYSFFYHNHHHFHQHEHYWGIEDLYQQVSLTVSILLLINTSIMHSNPIIIVLDMINDDNFDHILIILIIFTLSIWFQVNASNQI